MCRSYGLDPRDGGLITYHVRMPDDRGSTRGMLAADPWDLAVASLELAAPWATHALKVGIVALINECMREIARPGGTKQSTVRAEELLKALRKMPYDG